MMDHMSVCAQGTNPELRLNYDGSPLSSLFATDPNSPIMEYKPSKLSKILHPRSSKSEHAGRRDHKAKMMRQNARETEHASKQSWESRRSQDSKSSEESLKR